MTVEKPPFGKGRWIKTRFDSEGLHEMFEAKPSIRFITLMISATFPYSVEIDTALKGFAMTKYN